MTARNELDVLDPPSDTYTFESGLVVKVLPLKTRQFFAMLRIITHGGSTILGSALGSMLSGDEDDMVAQLMGLLMFAIPEAESETLYFLRSMVDVEEADPRWKPADLASAQADVDDALENPDILDTLGLVELIVRRESRDLAGLGKRLRSMLTVASKTGQLKKSSPAGSKASTPKGSSEPSDTPSTSSSQSTDGQTNKSSTSPSDD